ncbi:MAG TPA: hypothetical protein VFT74_13670, partial [Isosphaeraceae bacterium]|nr:hypothetical protein [Isosphaeraceae bacterium]
AGAPANARWVARCRARLIESRPDHLFARFGSVAEALRHPTVARAIANLRALYPPGKVANLVRRDEVSRSHWTGRRPSLSVILNDLCVLQEKRPAISRRTSRRSVAPIRAPEAVQSQVRFALGVMWTIAILMEVVERESGGRAGSRAA